MAVGRVGCLLTETPGTPTGTPFGISLDAATAERLGTVGRHPLHPSFGYEIAFHAVAFVVLWTWLRHRVTSPGETFVLYVAAYGVFRFLVEFVRGQRGRLARAEPAAALPPRRPAGRARPGRPRRPPRPLPRHPAAARPAPATPPVTSEVAA